MIGSGFIRKNIYKNILAIYFLTICYIIIIIRLLKLNNAYTLSGEIYQDITTILFCILIFTFIIDMIYIPKNRKSIVLEIFLIDMPCLVLIIYYYIVIVFDHTIGEVVVVYMMASVPRQFLISIASCLFCVEMKRFIVFLKDRG